MSGFPEYSRGILQEMESVVTRARMFKHKPDGDVTFMKLQDKNRTPVPVFQDPLHYPHGTKFLAPGKFDVILADE